MSNKTRLILAALLTLWIFTGLPGSLFLPVADEASYVNPAPKIGSVVWIDVGETVDLNSARSLFTTISSETVNDIYMKMKVK